MKLKSTLFVITGLLAGVLTSSAASVALFNVGSGAGSDVLFADKDNNLLGGTGLVTVGYFAAGVTQDQIDSIPELVSALGGFTLITSATPGTSAALSAAGYLAEDPVSMGSITASGAGSQVALLGRQLYSITTNAASLAAATLSSQFALFSVAKILDDSPLPNDYVVNPSGTTPIIGTLGSFVGNPGDQGEGTYTTLKMDAVPEPSAALLGALGALGLLRRRRN